MIRILKTDLFRLFRSKVLLAFPLILTFSLISGLLFSARITEEEEKANTHWIDTTYSRDVNGGYITEIRDPESIDSEQKGVYYNDTDEPMQIVHIEEDGVEIKVTIQPGETFVSTDRDFNARHILTSLPEFLEGLYDGLLLFFLGLTVVIFCTCETRAGFVKNAAGCVIDRRHMPLSKMIVGFVVLLIYTAEFAIYHFLSIFLESVITGKSIFFRQLPEGDAGKFWGFIIVCILIHMAFIALLILIHELSGNRAIGIVFAAIFGFGILEYMAEGAVYLLNHFFHILGGFNIDKYLLMKNILQGYDNAAYHPQITLVMAAIYLVAGTVLAMVVTKKRDVR